MCTSKPKAPVIPDPPPPPEPPPEITNPELKSGDDSVRTKSRRGKKSLKIDLNKGLTIPT